MGQEKTGPEYLGADQILIQDDRRYQAQYHGEEEREKRINGGVFQGQQKGFVGEYQTVVLQSNEGHLTQIETGETKCQIDQNGQENEEEKEQIEGCNQYVANRISIHTSHDSDSIFLSTRLDVVNESETGLQSRAADPHC
jgi:hypothetical protein